MVPTRIRFLIALLISALHSGPKIRFGWEGEVLMNPVGSLFSPHPPTPNLLWPSFQTRYKHCGALLTTEQQANQCQKSHLMELWQNEKVIWDTFASTLTECWPSKSMWKQQHWSARKVYQSWRLWLQRVLNTTTSSYFIKVWAQCHWLWTWSHNNGMGKSAKAGQSAERGNASHTGNHQGHTHWEHQVHARPPTNANQTVSGAVQSMLQCHQKSPQPIPWSHEKHKGL